MKKNPMLLLLSMSLAILVPVQGKLAIGIILILLLNLLSVATVFFKKLIFILHLDSLKEVLCSIFVVFFTLVFRQLLVLYSPLIVMNLGILIFTPALSVFILSIISQNDYNNCVVEFFETSKFVLIFSAFAFVFFILRDIFGYGSVSFPVPSGIYNIDIFSRYKYSFITSFVASIPGALILVSLNYILFSYIAEKFSFFSVLKGENDA